jgi:hypothetical protein
MMKLEISVMVTKPNLPYPWNMKGKARDVVWFGGYNVVGERETWGSPGSLGSLGEWRSEPGNWGREEGKWGREDGNW